VTAQVVGWWRRSGDVGPVRGVGMVAGKRAATHWSNSSWPALRSSPRVCSPLSVFFAGFPRSVHHANLYYQQACTTRRPKPPMAVMTFAVGSSIGSLRGGPHAHRYGGLQVVFGRIDVRRRPGRRDLPRRQLDRADTAVVLAAPLLIAGIGPGSSSRANRRWPVRRFRAARQARAGWPSLLQR